MNTTASRVTTFLWSVIIVIGLSRADVWSYEVQTHSDVSREAYELAKINDFLAEQLGVSGDKELGRNIFGRRRTAREWLREGSIDEDNQLRFFNHFYDPIHNRGLDATGRLLPMGASVPLRGERSHEWGLEDPREIDGQDFSYRDAREYFRLSLTESDPKVRERRLADTFYALGHVIHLIEDLASPPHTRNGPHGGQILLLDAGPKSVVEKYLDLDGVRQRLKFDGYPIPKAGFTKPRDFWVEMDASGTPRNGPDARGLSQIINRNFVSEGTNFTAFVDGNHHPEYADPILRTGDCYEELVETQDAEGRLIHGLVQFCRNSFRDPNTGVLETNPRMTTFSLFGRDLQELGFFVPQGFSLNALNAVSIGELTIPRAVGYSAGLLDYFFRGKLDVDLLEDSEDPLLLRLVGTNGSEEPLIDGTLKLYADNPEGQRVEAGALDSTTISNVAKDQPLPALRFQAPEGTERFVAVYEGTLGEEKTDPGRNFPGAVIGKVLGGVRVEEIFNDGSRWKMRTPTGVFLLPLTVAEFEEVKWGDPDDHLVARTPLGPDRPNRVAAYRLLRQEGTVEPETEATPQGPEVRLLKLGEATLPFGLQLGTTVHYTDTLSYRQQLVTLDRTDIYTFVNTDPERPLVGEYRFDRSEFGEVKVRTVASQTFTFEESFPLVLDEAHLTFSFRGTFLGSGLVRGDRVSYQWAIADVALNAAGHLVALVGVVPAFPVDGPILEQTLFGLDEKGELVPRKYCSSSNPSVCFTTVRIDPRFPGFESESAATPFLSALVDLTEGKLLHSTAGPEITITASEQHEAPAWTRLVHPEALVYVNLTIKRVGGDSPGEEGQVLGQSLMEVSSLPAQSLTTLTIRGPGSLTVTGWHQPALQDALDRAGFVLGSPEEVETLGGDEVAIWEIGPGIRLRLVSDTATFSVPAQFRQARRARPASEGERLVFTADGHTSALTKTLGVLVWDPGVNRAEVRLMLPEVPLEGSNFRILGAATRNAVLLHHPFGVGLGGVLVPLVDGSSVTTFDDPGALLDFTLLEPNFLYNFKLGKFFRLTPPLQATTLPAKLAEPGDPAGDYHVVRIK